MDPKSIANLDPKLRETYERVMGGSSSGTPHPPPSNTENQPAPMSPAPSGSDASATPTPITPPPDLSAPVSPDNQLSAPVPSATGSQSLGAPLPSSASTPYSPADLGLAGASQPSPGGMQPLSSPAAVAQTAQGTSNVVKLLYIFGGVIFFIVYIFFWIRIFNYQLPF